MRRANALPALSHDGAVHGALMTDGRRPTVRMARRRDLRATSRMHVRWLRTGLFPKLGSRFLRTYHASFVRSPAAVAFVADDGVQPVGFLVGTLDNDEHYRWVTRHRVIQLSFVGLRSLLRDRALLARFVRTRLSRYTKALGRRLRRPSPVTVAARYKPADADDPGPRTVAVLTHVVVAPVARGTGTGRQLVAAFVDQARAAGAAEVRLVSPIGTGAPAFYRALGWESVGRRSGTDGTLIEEFRLPLEGE